MLTGSNNFVMRLVSPGRQARGFISRIYARSGIPLPGPLSPTTVGSNLQVNRLRRFVTRASLAEFISFRLLARPSNWLACLSLFRSSLDRELYPGGKDTKTAWKRGARLVSGRVMASSLLLININNVTNISVGRLLPLSR